MSCSFSSYLSRLTFVTLRVSTIFFSGTRVVGCCVAVDLPGAACAAAGAVAVDNDACVAKSYPRCWNDFAALKGESL